MGRSSNIETRKAAGKPDAGQLSLRGAYGLLTATALFWGANTVFAKLAVGHVSPMALVMLRWLVVVAIVAIVARREIKADWPVLRRRLPFLATMGALGLASFNALFYVAAHHTAALNIGIIQGAMPAFILIGALAVHRTPIGRWQSAGVVITIGGVAVLASGGEIARLADLALNGGDMLIVMAAVLYAGYSVGLRDKPQTSALALFLVLAASAFVASVPLVLVEAAAGAFEPPSVQGWVVVGLVAVFPSLLSQIFFIKGVEAIGPGRAGIFVNLVPVFAAVLAVLVLDEPFEPHHAVALGLVLAGIGLSERSVILGLRE